MQGAERLATKYSKYCYLMAIDTEDFVYSFAEAVPAPTDEAYFARVRELHDASVVIGECSLKCELFKLVRVETSEAAKVRASSGERSCLPLTKLPFCNYHFLSPTRLLLRPKVISCTTSAITW